MSQESDGSPSPDTTHSGSSFLRQNDDGLFKALLTSGSLEESSEYIRAIIPEKNLNELIVSGSLEELSEYTPAIIPERNFNEPIVSGSLEESSEYTPAIIPERNLNEPIVSGSLEESSEYTPAIIPERNQNEQIHELAAENIQGTNIVVRSSGEDLSLQPAETNWRDESTRLSSDVGPAAPQDSSKKRKRHGFSIKLSQPETESFGTDTPDEKRNWTTQLKVADQTYEVNSEELKSAVEVGSGSFGRVLKLPFKGPGVSFVAVKCLDTPDDGEKRKKFCKELATLQTIASNPCWPYINHFYGVCLDSNKTPHCFFLEYMETDLEQAYKNLHAKQLSSPKNLRLVLRRVIFNIVWALRIMFDCNLSHNDVKPANILLDRKGNVKLADFGESDHIRNGKTADKTSPGTRYYWPPECAKRPIKCSSQRFNLWALGITLLEIILNKHPHPPGMADFQFDKHLENWRPTIPLDRVSKDCADFIMKYLLPEYRDLEKITYMDIMESDYLTGISGEPSQEETSLFESIIK